MLIVSFIVFLIFFALISLAIEGQYSKYTALTGSVIVLGLQVYFSFVYLVPELYNFQADWIPSLGISFYLKSDGFSHVLLLLTNLLTPFIILSSFNGREYSNKSNFYALILFMQAALIGVFTAYDGFLFYVCWEAALIPVYFISAIWGGEDKIRVTFKFFIYTIFGSLFMLMGLIYLYLQTGDTHSFAWTALSTVQLDATEELFIFVTMFLAFAIKIPLFPFHTWQPDTYTVSPSPGTMLLAGIMLKMGFFGIVRWLFPITQFAVTDLAPYIMAIGVLGVIYASIIAIKQKDFKRLVAFSSIAHVSLITAGLFSGNLEGVQGAIIQMFNHGINAVGLFFVLEVITQRTNTRLISELGGIVHKAPLLSICFMIILLGSIALPLTNGFPGEFLILLGLYKYNMVLAAIAGLTIVFGAVYMLRMYKTIMLGETRSATENFKDLSFAEMAVLFPLCILVIGLGLYPNFILSISEPLAIEILNYVTLKGASFSALLN